MIKNIKKYFLLLAFVLYSLLCLSSCVFIFDQISNSNLVFEDETPFSEAVRMTPKQLAYNKFNLGDRFTTYRLKVNLSEQKFLIKPNEIVVDFANFEASSAGSPVSVTKYLLKSEVPDKDAYIFLRPLETLDGKNSFSIIGIYEIPIFPYWVKNIPLVIISILMCIFLFFLWFMSLVLLEKKTGIPITGRPHTPGMGP